MVMFTTNRTSHTLVACSQYIMLRLFPTDSVVRLTGPGQDWHTNAKGKVMEACKPKGRFFWYAYDALTYIGAVLKHAEGISLRYEAICAIAYCVSFPMGFH